MRKPDPERLHSARRSGILGRLTRGGTISAERAEALVSAWEAEAAARGLARDDVTYWTAGWAWIVRPVT